MCVEVCEASKLSEIKSGVMCMMLQGPGSGMSVHHTP